MVIQVLKPHTTAHCRCILRKVCLILLAFLRTSCNQIWILAIHRYSKSYISILKRPHSPVSIGGDAAFRKTVTRKVGAITTIPLLMLSQGFSSIVEFITKLVFQVIFFFFFLTCTFQAEVQVMLPCKI